MAHPVPGAPPATPQAPSKDPMGEATKPDTTEPKPPVPPAARSRSEDVARRDTYWRSFERGLASHEKSFRSKVSRYLNERRSEVLRFLGEQRSMRASGDSIEQWLAQARARWDEELSKLMAPEYAAAARSGVESIAKDLGGLKTISAVDPKVAQFVADKTLKVTQGGVERELTVDEGLQLQTYQAALKGSKMAVRAVLKMIEKREKAIAKRSPAAVAPIRIENEHDSDNANEAMLILDIAQYAGPDDNRRMRVSTWAAQAGLSRPGRPPLSEKEVGNVKFFTLEPDKLKWPKRCQA